MKFTFLVLSSAACTAGFPAVARASLVTPGGAVEGFDTTLIDRPELGGTVLVSDHFTVPLSNGGAAIGLVSAVLREQQSGSLNFYYRLDNETPTVIGLSDVSIGGFGHLSTDVANLLDTNGQTAAPVAARTADGDTLVFDFDDVASRITPGGESFTFVIRTNATNFGVRETMTIRGFTTDSIELGSPPIEPITAVMPMYVPSGASPIPLPPAAVAALPTVVSIAALARARRRRPRIG